MFSYLCKSDAIQLLVTGNSENPGNEQVDLGMDISFLGLMGVGAFVSGFVQEYLWKYTAANQSMRIRKAFVTAVFKQEIGFFEGVSL